jgi:WD40 repeat protein
MIFQSEGRLSLLDVTSGDVIETYTGALYANTNFFALSPDGRLAAIWNRSASTDRLNVFSLALETPLLELGRFPRADEMRFSPDGQILAVVRGNTVELWSMQTAQIVRTLSGLGRAVGPLAFSPDGSRLFAASGEIWSVADGTLAATFESTTDAIALSPNGQVMAGREGTLWNASNGQPIDELASVRGPALSFTFTSDGRWLIRQDDDGIVEVWGLP